ncbi:hypothetical protein OH492_13180 [Vibrio chagasii]|nr:hypothetical protein [Vibrio chagasii]
MDRVLNSPEINKVLKETTGWQVQPRTCVLDHRILLTVSLICSPISDSPVANISLRTRDEFDYLQEPDFFHEIFGHFVPALTDLDFAATEQYGKLGCRYLLKNSECYSLLVCIGLRLLSSLD